MLHEHVYDDAGRMVETLVHTEPEWDTDEVDLMIAAHLLEQETGPHGQPYSESVGKQANPDSPEHTHRYETDLPVTDWALRAQLEAAREFEQQLEEAGIDERERSLILRSTHFTVRRVEREPGT
ncbi:hypothetical protein [Agrococcus sp. Marseille-Q4369]|uniref:hypothetical protein n=1 Tax=Agrococcus sp. Marseille-Q4369 TaxID=2810513 RepID=UPI001B8BB4B8|nr:hypothetical protein [Agrococcus sp. Marseille-Q4369]QUW18896.1 hypothetical protein JSQ78_00480 [Agrococcus sp. Marseille-Q4369]